MLTPLGAACAYYPPTKLCDMHNSRSRKRSDKVIAAMRICRRLNDTGRFNYRVQLAARVLTGLTQKPSQNLISSLTNPWYGSLPYLMAHQWTIDFEECYKQHKGSQS